LARGADLEAALRPPDLRVPRAVAGAAGVRDDVSQRHVDQHGLAVAQRGQTALRGADDTTHKAKGLEPRRGEASYNLGVLYKAFLASKEDDLDKSKAAYAKAKGYFQEYLGKDGLSADDKEEAQQNIKDCDKVMKQIDDFKKMQAAQKAMMDSQPK
jgi:hypothetical protein